jgi:hypothetical protein
MHVDNTASKICQFAFWHVGETMKRHISNDPTKNGISKKFKTFISQWVAVFGLPRAMNESLT